MTALHCAAASSQLPPAPLSPRDSAAVCYRSHLCSLKKCALSAASLLVFQHQHQHQRQRPHLHLHQHQLWSTFKVCRAETDREACTAHSTVIHDNVADLPRTAYIRGVVSVVLTLLQNTGMLQCNTLYTTFKRQRWPRTLRSCMSGDLDAYTEFPQAIDTTTHSTATCVCVQIDTAISPTMGGMQ